MSRLCVVTGAASGIGKAVTDMLRNSGDEVLGLDRTAGDGIATLDLSSPDAGDEALTLLNGRDANVLVNVAAVFHSGDLEHTRGTDWDRLYAVNLRAPYLLARALAPGLARQRGAIVNVSSVNGIRNARANIAYDSLKAALDHMTRGLALELWEQGVRVNAVAPGGTATQGLKDWMTRQAICPIRRAPTASKAMWRPVPSQCPRTSPALCVSSSRRRQSGSTVRSSPPTMPSTFAAPG